MQGNRDVRATSLLASACPDLVDQHQPRPTRNGSLEQLHGIRVSDDYHYFYHYHYHYNYNYHFYNYLLLTPPP